MNPRIASHGLSFKGAYQYYMHDPKADTRQRIAWAETHGMLTDNPDLGWKVMAYTAKSQDRLKQASGQRATGRKDVKPVMAYSLSWHPNHDPDRDHMQETALRSLKVLGLEDHEAIIVAHRDTPHRHVHVIANRIHPISGLVADDSYTKRKLSDFAREYQQEHNMNYCPKREENHQKRLKGQSSKYRDPKIEQAWKNSDSGAGFVAALKEQGYRLAQGRKRLVVVDPYGKTHNPVRHIEGIKAKDLNARLADVDKSTLQNADDLAREVQATHEARKQNPVSKEQDTPKAKNDFKKASKKPAPTPKGEFNRQSKKQTESEKKQPLKQVDQNSEKASVKNEKPKGKPAPEKEKTAAINAYQSWHLREQENLSQKSHYRILNEEKRLSEFYRINEHEEQIKAMQDKIETAPWWRKLFKLTQKDERELSNLQRGFDEARMRYNEKINTLRNEFAEARTQLREKYDQSPYAVSKASPRNYSNSEKQTERLSKPYNEAANDTKQQERQKRIEYIRNRQEQNKNRDRGANGINSHSR